MVPKYFPKKYGKITNILYMGCNKIIKQFMYRIVNNGEVVKFWKKQKADQLISLGAQTAQTQNSVPNTGLELVMMA